jgi:multiple sugar transport system substrate-binding protein
MKKKQTLSTWSIVSLFLILALVLSSCSGSRPSPSPSTPEAGGQTIITFGGYEYQRSLYEPLIETFQDQNPGIQVQMVDLNQVFQENFSSDEVWNPFTYYRQLAQAADVVLIQGVFNADMSRYFRDLQPLYEADPAFQANDFWPGILTGCEDTYGNLIGLPMSAYVTGLFYDEAAFRAAGLPLPGPGWTWDDFQKAVSTLTSGSGDNVRYGFYDQPSLHTSILAPFIHEHMVKNGGEVAAQDLLNEVGWYIDLARAGRMMGLVGEDQMGEEWEKRMRLFENEETRPAMWVDSLISYLPNTGHILDGNEPLASTSLYRYGFAPFPIAADGSMPHTSRHWAECGSISAGSKNPRAAWAWLNFISRQWLVMDQSQIYEIGRAPARQSVADSAGYWDMLPAKAVPAVRYALEHGSYSMNYIDFFGDITVALVKTIAGQADFEQTLAASIAARPPTPTPPPDPGPIVVATPMPPLPPGTVAVKYYISAYGPSEMTAIKALAEQFNQRSPERQIRISTDFYGGPDVDWISAIAANFDCFTSNPPAWEGTDLSNLLNLTPLFSAEPASFTADFSTSMLDKFRSGGNLYALPASSQVMMMAYNADLLARRGLPLPDNSWTYEDFLEMAAAAASTSASDPSYGFMASAYEDFIFSGRGVRWVDHQANPPAALFNTPEMREHLRWVAAQADSRVFFFQDENWEELQTIVTQGQIAFWTAMMGEKNPYYYDASHPAPYRVGLAPLPELPGDNAMATWSNDRGHYISAKTAEPRVCWDWFKFLSEQPTLFGGVPARRSIAESPAWEASVGRTEAEAYRAALSRVKPAEENITEAQRYTWPLYQWRSTAIKAAMEGKDLQPVLVDIQQKAEGYLACAQTLDDSLSPEEYHQGIQSCLKQADPEGNW